MGETILEIRDRLRPNVYIPGQLTIEEAIVEAVESPVFAEVPAPEISPRTEVPVSDHSFAVESEETGKIIVTVPAREDAETASVSAQDFVLNLSGRLVEADKPNGNGAFWSYGDLEFGLPSVAYGPLNWLHQERKVVGVLTNAQLVARDMASEINPHVRADSVLWKWLYPAEAREVAEAADKRQLWYSMECIARKIECVGDEGCGHVVDYRERSSEKACQHMRERSASRRLVEPIFQGAAIIIPPVRPGWASADLEVTRQAAALIEDKHLDVGLSSTDAERMVAQVLAYANS